MKIQEARDIYKKMDVLKHFLLLYNNKELRKIAKNLLILNINHEQRVKKLGNKKPGKKFKEKEREFDKKQDKYTDKFFDLIEELTKDIDFKEQGIIAFLLGLNSNIYKDEQVANEEFDDSGGVSEMLII